jgi:hypothetical protein
MSEMQVVFLFCVVYSGALSLAIWANLLAQKRMETHFAEERDSFQKFERGA